MSEPASVIILAVIGSISMIGTYLLIEISKRKLAKREKALKEDEANFEKHVANWQRANRTLHIANEVYTEIRNTDPEKIHDIILDYVTSKEFSKADLRKLMKGYKMIQCINCVKEQMKNGCHE